MPSNLIAIEAENLIVEQEVSNKAVYTARYQRPVWPSGSSGVTIGIGVDLGYTTYEQLERDWSSFISEHMISLLHQAIGIKGEHAHIIARSGVLAGVVIPWDTAIAEFEQVEIPRIVSKTNRVYPGLEKLGPLCEGACASLIFNRGTQLIDLPGSNTRREMLAIRQHLADGRPELIPNEFRKMKRLWQNGLVARREAEAELFELGLAHNENVS